VIYGFQEFAARKFLVYGQLVRPLTFSAPSPMPMLDHVNDYRMKARFPALTSGVFRTQDGELGIFVVNIGGEDLLFRANLDTTLYCTMINAMDRRESISRDGVSKPATAKTRDVVWLKGNLNSHTITMFRINLRQGMTSAEPAPSLPTRSATPQQPKAAPRIEQAKESRYHIPYRP